MDPVILLGAIITVVTAIPVLYQLRKHPRGLYVLFFAEMWERFSYYGMRGLLIFYLTQQFLFDDTFSQGQYGAYASLVYLMPLIGGFLADRYLGTRKAVAFGALLLVAGHFTMAIEDKPATQVLTYQGAQFEFVAIGRGDASHVTLKVGDHEYEVGASADGGMEIKGLPDGQPLPRILPKGSYQVSVTGRNPLYVGIFYLALSLIIMGVGFLKPNISTIVGQLYTEHDPRRDPGFTLYYYGINLGAFWAAILCGYLGQNYGWWAGFGAAGVGMLIGYIAFVLGKPLLEGKGEPPDAALLKRSVFAGLNLESFIYVAGILGVGVVWFVVQRSDVVGYMLAVGSVVVLGYLLFYMLTRATWIESSRLILALVLIAASVVFFTLFEQGGSSLNQYAARNSILTIGGVTFDAAQTQSFNSGFILLLAPFFSAVWAYLGKRQLDPNAPAKFGLGLLQVGAGFYVLVWGAQHADPDTFKVPLIFLILAYLLHTTGELCLSPVGLSQMTRLSPAALISTVMATWFLASSWAQYLGGMVAQMTASETVGGQVLDPGAALHRYSDTFAFIGQWGMLIGAGLLILSPILGMLAQNKARAASAAREAAAE